MPVGWCLCALVPRVDSRVPIDLVRHVRETGKLSNSARLADLALPRLTMHAYGAPGPAFDVAPLLRPGSALLFPADPTDGSRIADPATVRHLVVLDGTWGQTRRMARRLAPLADLPRLVLPGSADPRHRLRQPHMPGGMATLEAIAAALDLLEGPESSAPLLALFDEFVRRGRALRGKGRPPPGVDPGPHPPASDDS